MTNPFLSDPQRSPFISTTIQELSLRQQNEEIKLQNLKEDLEMFIPVDLAQVSSNYSANFTAGTIKTHRYQIPLDMPYEPMIFQLKAENDESLKVNLSIEFDESTILYNLHEDNIQASFRKIDDHLYIAEHLSSRPHFVNVMVAGPGNASRAIHVKYTVTLYFAQCVYWDRERIEWSDTGCKVRKK